MVPAPGPDTDAAKAAIRRLGLKAPPEEDKPKAD
jgi:hypothetical protein